MEFKISKEALEQVALIVEQIPTKWGLPLTQLLQENIKPIGNEISEPSVESPGIMPTLSWGYSGISVDVFKGDKLIRTTKTTGNVKSANGVSKTKLEDGTFINSDDGSFLAGDPITVKGYTYKLS